MGYNAGEDRITGEVIWFGGGALLDQFLLCRLIVRAMELLGTVRRLIRGLGK